MDAKTKKMNLRTKQSTEKQKLNIKSEYVMFRDIEESPINAQTMNDKDFNRLVKNLKRDGVLTSSPLLMDQTGKQKTMCISGHHRIKAAIKAGIEGCVCLISDELDDSTRIRLQVAHNDIHGEPNEDILAIMQQSLSEIDISLVDSTDIEKEIKEVNETEFNIPNFQYINICLLDTTRSNLVDLIISLEKSDSINWLIEKPEYENVKDMLTFAFEHGFKTPGQAFNKFMEIVKENIGEIKR